VPCIGIAVLAGFANSVGFGGFGGFAAEIAGLAGFANSICFGRFATHFVAHLAGFAAGSAA